MAKATPWLSLANKVIQQQNAHTKRGALTVKVMQQFFDILISKRSLTPKQQAHFIRNINMHLQMTLAVNQPPIVLTRNALEYWRSKAKPNAIEAHWDALISHYGTLHAVAVEAANRAGRPSSANVPAAAALPNSVQSSVTPQAAPQALTRQGKTTLSIWQKGSALSGNLDYGQNNEKERVIFESDWFIAKSKLDRATNQTNNAALLANVENIRQQIKSQGLTLRYGLLHHENDPMGLKAPTLGGVIVLTVHQKPDDKLYLAMLVSANHDPCAFDHQEQKPKGNQPNIKATLGSAFNDLLAVSSAPMIASNDIQSDDDSQAAAQSR